MAHPHPSIQSFFKREVHPLPTPPSTSKYTTTSLPSSPPPANPSSPTRPGEGFTPAELAAAQDPLACVFNPTREYEKREIGRLETGPLPVCFVGRVVNFSVTYGKSKSQGAARGCIGMVVADGTGAIAVRLYFASQPYPLTLGLLLTIWTPFIATASSVTKDPTYLHPSTPLSTSIIPGRDSSVHILLHVNSDQPDYLRLPLDYTPTTPLPGLMNLKAFLDGGHEVPSAKLLLAVKSIGARKSLPCKKTDNKNTAAATNTTATTIDLVPVVLFDETASITLKLWREAAASARAWKPSSTLLLLTRPLLKDEPWGRAPTLALGHASMLEVDPSEAWADARWLRRWVRALWRRESVAQDVPAGLWDVAVAEGGVDRILFSLADVDAWVRRAPGEGWIGWLSLVVLEMGLVRVRQRGMLMVTECCGIPLYANLSHVPCPHCGTYLTLALNPALLTTLLDETGSLAPSSLLWTPRAWAQLLGRGVDDLLALDVRDTRWLEQRIVGLRFSFFVGWEEAVGKLCVLGVRM